MTFKNLNLIPQILQSLTYKGYITPTAIQQRTIPLILGGKDVIGSSQTGTGKTAAFALPLLQRLFSEKTDSGKVIKALILAPTRELAQQISDSFRDYGKGLFLKHAVVYGGVKQRPQTDALRAGIDILIATPGRLLDLMNQGYVRLHAVEYFVLDEMDRMLDMGFINDIRKIIQKIPQKKQTLFFSATFPPEIERLANSLLKNPEIVRTDPVFSAAAGVKQYLYIVQKENRRNLLRDILINEPMHHILVFTRTKRGADKLVKSLRADSIRAESIHGNKSQAARQKALLRFKDKKVDLLIATDVASRGLDITNISHVINYDMPENAKVYIHRIGRTGRAGAAGKAISFCSSDEQYLIKGINKLSDNKLEIIKKSA